MCETRRPVTTKQRVPAVDGWFEADGEPHLLGSRCSACGTVFFPRATGLCRNPDCDGVELEDTRLSRRGTVWSYTEARYQPPPPFVPPTDPFEPFAIAAVELPEEELVVLGQVARGVTVDELRIGMDVELTVEPLFEDDEHEYVVWKWKPVTP